ncbi:MAG: alanine:cation symporter family protein, partial [Longicatena sp.]
QCFEQGFGSIGGILFAISILSFAIPSIVGWYYYASECIRYLFTGKWMLHVYQFIFLALLIIGPQLDLNFVWNVADTLNGFMAIPNLLSILILNKDVVKCTQEYIAQYRSD